MAFNQGITPGFNPLGGGPTIQQRGMMEAGLSNPSNPLGPRLTVSGRQPPKQIPQQVIPTQQAVSQQPIVPQQVAQQQPMQQQSMQPFGLSGSEQALQAGLQGGLSALGQGQNSALGTLQIGNQFAQNQLQQGRDALSAGNQGAQNFLQQGVNALGGDFRVNAAGANTNAGQAQFQQAAAGVNRFTDAGLQAQQRQAALSGALGNEAQAQAFTEFNESPGQAFLRQQGLDAVTNQASATGGVGGGELLRDLTRFGTGVAAQDFQNQFNNLGSLSGQGLQAAGQAGNFLSQGGQTQAQLAGQNAQMQQQANIASQQNRLNQAQNIGQLFSQGAGMQNQLGQNQANLFGQGGSLAANLASQGANFQNQGGMNAANLFTNAGQNIAQGRFQTGTNLANQIGQGTSALSNLANQQGIGNADIIGQGGQNIANLLSGAGQLDASQQQQLAAILANLNTGQASQLANQQIGIGNAQADGRVAGANAINNLVGQGVGAFAALGGLGGGGGGIISQTGTRLA